MKRELARLRKAKAALDSPITGNPDEVFALRKARFIKCFCAHGRRDYNSVLTSMVDRSHGMRRVCEAQTLPQPLLSCFGRNSLVQLWRAR